MKLVHTILLIATLSVVGCDILHVQQYRVTGVTPKSEDASRLQSVLQSVADKTGLKDCTLGSGETNMLLFYAQSDKRSLPTLSARFSQDDVIVELFGGFGTPRPFRQAQGLLTPALSTEFGSRFSASR